MTKSARAALCNVVRVEGLTGALTIRETVRELSRRLEPHGYVILPKEPSEGMIHAGIDADFNDLGVAAIYRSMISHAEREKG